MKNRGNTNHRELTQLEKARLNKGLSISEVCQLTNLSYDNYIKYEREEIKPQYMCFDTIRRISSVLEIDLMSDYHYFKANSAQVVKEYMDNHNLSIRKFAEKCKVSVTTVKNWRNGSCSPSYDKWEQFFK